MYISYFVHYHRRWSADHYERIRQINNVQLICNIPNQNTFRSLLIPLYPHSRSLSARFRGSEWKKMLLTSEEKKGRKRRRYISFFARGGERRRVFKGEFIGDISRPGNVDIAQHRLLSIPINHRHTTARTRINTRPKIHVGSFSCRDAIATCDHGPTFSWRSHIGASRARHAYNYVTCFSSISLWSQSYKTKKIVNFSASNSQIKNINFK